MPVYLLAIFLFFSSGSFADSEEITSTTVKGYYTGQDGRVKGHLFPINLKLNVDGSFSGEMETWVAAYLSNGIEELHSTMEQISGRWVLEKDTIKLKAGNAYLPDSTVLHSDNGLPVLFVRSQPDRK